MRRSQGAQDAGAIVDHVPWQGTPHQRQLPQQRSPLAFASALAMLTPEAQTSPNVQAYSDRAPRLAQPPQTLAKAPPLD